MRDIAVYIVLFALSQLVTGCVYHLNDPNGFYKTNRKRISSDDMLRSIIKRYPGNILDFDSILGYMQSSAGPFNIANAVVMDIRASTSWSYNGQGSDWPDVYPSCGGDRQSPIEIMEGHTSENEYPPMEFEDYTNIHPHMSIVNNGHTVDVMGPWGPTGESSPKMSGGPLEGTYKLLGVHFHWGYNDLHGSEHKINEGPGVAEMHFVHYNTKYENETIALESGDPEGLAVMGIIFQLSYFATPEAEPIFTTLEQALAGEVIYPAVFPLDLINFDDSYFTYQGSLTTPPCSENVKWIVRKKPILINTSNLNTFMKFQHNGTPIVGNYRSLMPVNGRDIMQISESNDL